MRQLVTSWVFGAAAVTVAFLVAHSVAPGRRELEVDVYVLLLGGLALLVLGSWARAVAPLEGISELEQALSREPPPAPRIAELDRLERELAMGATRAFDLHYRLRPTLSEIAAGRLQRRGLQLESGTAAVRETLGDDLWDLTRPGREPPLERLDRGPGLERLRAAIERLEQL